MNKSVTLIHAITGCLLNLRLKLYPSHINSSQLGVVILVSLKALFVF